MPRLIDDPLWGKIVFVDSQKFQEILDKIKPLDVATVVRCKNCKYNPKNARLYSDDDPVLSYLMCGRLEDGENGFCSNGKEV